jgi:hypothetical protein
VAEAYANNRLLRLAQCPLDQPFRDALTGMTRDRLERAYRLAQLGQRRDDPLIDSHVCAYALQNLARMMGSGRSWRRKRTRRPVVSDA